MAVQAFVSYSHDSPTHKQWVITLARALVSMGVDVILDEWSLMAGEDVVAFMRTGIATADKVVLVCSEHYVKKADGQVGGAGYEGLIVGGEILRTIDTKKFIPVVRANETVNKMPGSLGARKYIDFSDNALYGECPTGSRKSAATVNTSYPTFCISAMLSSSRSRCAFSIQRCS